MREQGIGHLPLRFRAPNPDASQEIDLHIVCLENGDNPDFLLVMEDLDRVKAKEEYQWRAAKLAAAGEVGVAVAHKIRNHLAIIRGSVRLFPDRLHDREFLLRLSEVLQQEIDHVNSTLEALLAFTRVAEPCFETINLAALLASTARLIEPYASSHNVQVLLNDPGLDYIRSRGCPLP